MRELVLGECDAERVEDWGNILFGINDWYQNKIQFDRPRDKTIWMDPREMGICAKMHRKV